MEDKTLNIILITLYVFSIIIPFIVAKFAMKFIEKNELGKTEDEVKINTTIWLLVAMISFIPLINTCLSMVFGVFIIGVKLQNPKQWKE